MLSSTSSAYSDCAYATVLHSKMRSNRSPPTKSLAIFHTFSEFKVLNNLDFDPPMHLNDWFRLPVNLRDATF